jgi:hypothetical protein
MKRKKTAKEPWKPGSSDCPAPPTDFYPILAFWLLLTTNPGLTSALLNDTPYNGAAKGARDQYAGFLKMQRSCLDDLIDQVKHEDDGLTQCSIAATLFQRVFSVYCPTGCPGDAAGNIAGL